MACNCYPVLKKRSLEFFEQYEIVLQYWQLEVGCKPAHSSRKALEVYDFLNYFPRK
jgi:hypothetical protein